MTDDEIDAAARADLDAQPMTDKQLGAMKRIPPARIIRRPIDTPAAIAQLIRDSGWMRVTIGQSGAAVYRVRSPDGEDLYLKHGRGHVATEVAEENERLNWLNGHIAVPVVRCAAVMPDDAWLLMSALPGSTARHVLETETESRASTIAALARFARRLHAVPVETCPFDATHHLRLDQARRRLDAGEVHAEDFDEDHANFTPEELWRAMTDLLPFKADRVVTHGDLSLDNIMMKDGEVVGCIDVARAGIADRYQDLAILCNGLGDFDPMLQQQLFAAYGIESPDLRKLRFHRMLDEFY